MRIFRRQSFKDGYSVSLTLSSEQLDEWERGILFINTGVEDDLMEDLLSYGHYEDFERMIFNPSPVYDKLRVDDRIHIVDGKVVIDNPDEREDIVYTCLDKNYIVWDGAQHVLGVEYMEKFPGKSFTNDPDQTVLIIDLEKVREER